MKDYSNNDVKCVEISGKEKHEEVAAKLCSDCRGIIQRVLDLENGEDKDPVRNYSRSTSRETHSPETSVFENGQNFEDSSIFQDLPEDNSMQHKSDRAELLASSQRGCLLCTWLFQSLQSRSKRSNATIIEQWLRRPATVERDQRGSFLSI